MPEVGTVWTFDYTGKEQEFITPCSGNYKVELWGAQGGSISGVAYNSDGSIRNNNLTYIGGKGAYTAGLINLNKNKILYVYVGGSPLQINTTLVSDGNHVGGFNGGESITSGQEIYGAPGGGATDIRLSNGNWNEFSSLKSRIMVAAGGGGGFLSANTSNRIPGHGGGLIGYDANAYYTGINGMLDDYSGHGATQQSVGKSGNIELTNDSYKKENYHIVEGGFGLSSYGINDYGGGYSSSGGGGGGGGGGC